MNVTFFPLGPFSDPSPRYRVYYIAEELKKSGVETKIILSTFPLYTSKFLPKRAYVHIINFIRWLYHGFIAERDSILFLQKGTRQIGAYYLFLFFKRVLGRKIVFDFDDAIFIKRPKNMEKVLELCDAVTVGSHFLKEFAEKYNDNVYIIPTSVDTEKYTPSTKKNTATNIVIGWVGLPTNIEYLQVLVEPLKVLGKKYEVELRILTDPLKVKRLPPFENIKVKIVPWQLNTEWNEISKFDIGVMPLNGVEWDKGKCAFKAIQYMTMGVPTVCSAVGENNYLIKDGKNGFLASSSSEWIEKLEKLIIDKKLRKNTGELGRKTIEENYSLKVNVKKMLRILQRI